MYLIVTGDSSCGSAMTSMITNDGMSSVALSAARSSATVCTRMPVPPHASANWA